ncbi:hypothetical protein E2C01_008638 [Portunus trituberculatus]|uniref:Uncharacterized protein n=1 Tax=Portunus trituberculatus TaxID=210409 RepID=A0A5B7D3D6_PORTR|nr:hypothetical protein [Portunus trituberculatus]
MDLKTRVDPDSDTARWQPGEEPACEGWRREAEDAWEKRIPDTKMYSLHSRKAIISAALHDGNRNKTKKKRNRSGRRKDFNIMHQHKRQTEPTRSYLQQRPRLITPKSHCQTKHRPLLSQRDPDL